jgi:hypothetical protein
LIEVLPNNRLLDLKARMTAMSFSFKDEGKSLFPLGPNIPSSFYDVVSNFLMILQYDGSSKSSQAI